MDEQRFTIDELELKTYANEIHLISPGMSDFQGVRARDQMGHLISALRGAEKEIARLEGLVSMYREQRGHTDHLLTGK